MAFDASVAGANSNSYADVAYADAYHASRLFNTEWSAASTPSKEAALIWATRLLDVLPWASFRANRTQALRWPQYEAYDQDGWLVPTTEIPRNVKDATSEFALYLLKEDRTADTGATVIDELKVGPIELKFDTTAGTKAVPDSVMSLIQHYLQSGGGISHNLSRA